MDKTAVSSVDAERGSLLSAIYGAAADPASWPALFERVGRWLGAGGGMMLSPRLPDVRPVPLCIYGLDLGLIAEAYPRHAGQAQFTNRALALGRAPDVFMLDELFPPDARADDLFWQEMMAAPGISAAQFALVRTPDESRPVVMNFFRFGEAEPFTDTDADRLRALLPHLRRALSVSLDREPSSAPPPAIVEFAETSPGACVLLGAEGRVLYANTRALQLARWDVIAIENDTLRLPEPAADRTLGEAVARLTGEPWSGEYRIGVELVFHAEPGGPPLILSVEPLGKNGPFVAVTSPVRCVARIHDTASDDTVGLRARLKKAFLLTDAEADITADLCAGLSAAQIGAFRRTTPGTVRLQIRAVLAKIGARNQTALVALATRLRF